MSGVYIPNAKLKKELPGHPPGNSGVLGKKAALGRKLYYAFKNKDLRHARTA